MELTVPAAEGASQPEEAGPESNAITAGIEHVRRTQMFLFK